MALNHSLKVVTDGLVFYYDMANTKKSNVGDATSNLISNGNFSNGLTGWNNYAGSQIVTTVYDFPTAIGIPKNVVQCNTLQAIHGGGNFGGLSRAGMSSLLAGTTYTVSFYARHLNSGTMDFRFSHQSGSGDNSNLAFNSLITNSWAKYTKTATLDLSKSTLYIWNQNIAGGSFQISDIQIEAKSYPTPFTSTSRNNTQSILDLTSNNVITVSSLTYEIDGTFSFNGSNRLNLTMVGSSSLSKYTRIVWIKPTSTSGDMKSAMLNQIGNNSDMAVGIEAGYPSFHQYTKTGTDGTADGDWTLRGATLTSINNIYMIAITVDRLSNTNNIKVYLNGKLDGTGSRVLGTAASDNVIFGGPVTDDYAGSRMFYGNIYAAYQYNRVLSEAEILQNFNAIRGRYGI